MNKNLWVLLGLVAFSTSYTLPQHTHRLSHAAPVVQQNSSPWAKIFGGQYASAYSGYDLFINGAWINTDNDLLRIDQKNPAKDSFLVSGALQALLTDDLKPKQSSQIALSDIEIQTFTTLDHVFHAFTDSMIGTQQLNVTTPRAFITLGDLNRSDFYLTAGKSEVSFGQYSTSVINVLPEISDQLGGITADSVTLGYDSAHQYLKARAYAYKSDLKFNDKRNVEGGIDLVKTVADKNIHSKTGISFVTDLADSWAISQVFTGHTLAHRLPAFNVRESLILPGNNTLVAEYVSSFNHLAQADLLTNGKTVRPGALHIEWNKGLTWLNKPVELALGYNQTYQASAFGLPVSRFYGVATISPIRRSALSLEVNDDQSYAASDSNQVGTKVLAAQDGKSHVSVYLLAGIYF